MMLLTRFFTSNHGKINNNMATDKEIFATELLKSDFEQSMEMLRHYDNFHWDITKFCFSQICVIIGACWYILDEGKSDKIVGVSIVPVLLTVSAFFTLICILSLCRNRQYFCKVSHYINELRNKAVSDNSVAFRNQSKMWVDMLLPIENDWRSTQLFSIYLLALCFASFCMGISFYIINNECKLLTSVLIGMAVLGVILGVIHYSVKH